MMPSTLSRKPPCPGSRLLVSLTFALRFKKEIIKSPIWDDKEIIIVTTIIKIWLSYKISSLKKGIKSNEKMKDPIDPDIVLLGLIMLSFFPLKVFPIIKPPISDAILTKIVYKIKIL